MPYSSDDQSLDCVGDDDDDDDDDYDVPPAFHLELNDVARLSSVTDTDACPRTDGDTETHTDDDDDDDDYDIPPAFRLDPCDAERRSLVVETVPYTTDNEYDTHHTNSYDDDDNYDVLPTDLRPTSLESGCPPPLYPDDDDIYDYPMTNSESQLASASLFAQNDELNGGWSGDAAQRTSTIDPDVDDDMYDYIGTYSDTERTVENASIGGDNQMVADDKVLEGTTCVDDFYDYVPYRSSAEGITHEVDGSGNCPMVFQHRRSSSSSSDDHYDVLPSGPALSSSQLSVRKSSASESTARSSAVTLDSATDEDCYDLTTSKHGTSNTVSDTAPLCRSANFESADAPKDNGDGGCSVPMMAVNKVSESSSSSDDYYDVLPCHTATFPEQLSVRKSSDAFAASTTSTGTSLPTVIPPTSRSTLSPSLPSQSSGQYITRDSKQTVNTCSDVTGHTVVTPVKCDQLHRRPTNLAENKPLTSSKLTTMCKKVHPFNFYNKFVKC